MKKTRFYDFASRRNLYAELLAWMSLEEHPNIMACRYFGTYGDELVILSDYMEGGSLATWIQERKITRLEEILDVAIQMAWGLHAIHEMQLIHQDVKPGNVLLTLDRRAKIADYGLAKARPMTGQEHQEGKKSILVSAGGMTPAYRSPEQASSRPLSRKTDIWSWGVSVLEMFAGEVFWSDGQAANEALEHYLNAGSEESSVAKMPANIADVLRKCFKQEQSERWVTMADVAELLQQDIYQSMIGKHYFRQRPILWRNEKRKRKIVDYRSYLVRKGFNAQEWFRKVSREEDFGKSGININIFDAKIYLIEYENIYTIYNNLTADGQKDLQLLFAKLCNEKAFLHVCTDEIPEALALHDCAIERTKNCNHYDEQLELAESYMLKALLVLSLDPHGLVCRSCAKQLIRKGVKVREQLLKDFKNETALRIAESFTSNAEAFLAVEMSTANLLFTRAIDIYELLVVDKIEDTNDLKVINDLVALYRALGSLYCQIGHIDRCIVLYETLIAQEKWRDLTPDLILVYLEKAKTSFSYFETRRLIGRAQTTLELMDQNQLKLRQGLKSHIEIVRDYSKSLLPSRKEMIWIISSGGYLGIILISSVLLFAEIISSGSLVLILLLSTVLFVIAVIIFHLE